MEYLRNAEDLCAYVEKFGYGGFPQQLQCNNGSYVSSLLNFFDDNPGALEVLKEWIDNNISKKEEYDVEFEEDAV